MLSPSYVESIITGLRKAGYVTGTRGPGGGYILASPPDNIDVIDIIDLFTYSNRRLALVLYVKDILSRITLADIIEFSKTSATH